MSNRISRNPSITEIKRWKNYHQFIHEKLAEYSTSLVDQLSGPIRDIIEAGIAKGKVHPLEYIKAKKSIGQPGKLPAGLPAGPDDLEIMNCYHHNWGLKE